jgi:hypothetical protein
VSEESDNVDPDLNPDTLLRFDAALMEVLLGAE